MHEGTYLAPFFGITGTQYDVGVLLNSSLTDWSSPTVVVVATSTSDYDEIDVEELPDGTLVAMIRSDTGVDTHRATSSDHGVTWSSATMVHDGYGYPMFRRLASGQLLSVYRDSPNGDTAWRTSTDDGATWGSETILDTTGARSSYATLLQLDATHALCVYAVEATGTGDPTDSDLYSQIFTDASTGFTYHDDLAGVTPDQHHAQIHKIDGSDHWTDETDMALVLKPDGSGGVAFGAQSGGGALDDLSDVTITSPATDEVLTYNGSAWVNEAPSATGNDVFTVDPGSVSYAGTTPTVTVTSLFGIDGSGNPYYNSANVTSGEEAALMRDATTGEYFLRTYNF